MKSFTLLRIGLYVLLAWVCSFPLFAQDVVHKAPAPLYRDPVTDGAADPVVVWNQEAKSWWMLYTSAGQTWMRRMWRIVMERKLVWPNRQIMDKPGCIGEH